MDGLIYLFESFMILFKHQFVIYGYTISFFDIFIFSSIACIVSYALGRLIGGD